MCVWAKGCAFYKFTGAHKDNGRGLHGLCTVRANLLLIARRSVAISVHFRLDDLRRTLVHRHGDRRRRRVWASNTNAEHESRLRHLFDLLLDGASVVGVVALMAHGSDGRSARRRENARIVVRDEFRRAGFLGLTR